MHAGCKAGNVARGMVEMRVVPRFCVFLGRAVGESNVFFMRGLLKKSGSVYREVICGDLRTFNE